MTDAMRLPLALDLKVVRQPIGALKLEGRAARTHSDRQMRALVASLKRFGFVSPTWVSPSLTSTRACTMRAEDEAGLGFT